MADLAPDDPADAGDAGGGHACGDAASGEPVSGPAGRRRRRDLRWTNRARARFVAVLAERYDYQAAMAAANLTWPEVCELRVRHPDFAARIDEVIAAGFDRIELTLLRLASEALAQAAPDVPFVQAIMKLRRPVRATGPVKASAKEEAAQLREIERVMGKITRLRISRERCEDGEEAGGRAHGQSE